MLRWVWECILREVEPIMFFFLSAGPGDFVSGLERARHVVSLPRGSRNDVVGVGVCSWYWERLLRQVSRCTGVQVSSASSRLNIREENWQCGISLVNARTELVLVGTCLRNYALQPIDANRLLSLRGEPNAVPEPFLKGSRR